MSPRPNPHLSRDSPQPWSVCPARSEQLSDCEDRDSGWAAQEPCPQPLTGPLRGLLPASCPHAWKRKPTQAGCWLTSPSGLKDMGLWAPPRSPGLSSFGCQQSALAHPHMACILVAQAQAQAGVQGLVHTGWTGGGPLVPAKWLEPHLPHPTPGRDLPGAAGGGRCCPP